MAPKPTPPEMRRSLSNSQATSKASTLSREAPATTKKLKPLSVPKLPLSASKADTKGKSKIKECSTPNNLELKSPLDVESDDRLWVDIYEPLTEADLAVHKRKVEDVRRWFTEAFDGGSTGKLMKYRRILVLSGPAGTGKTTTVRILARELQLEILEWSNALDEHYHEDTDIERETLTDKFETFIGRAAFCPPIQHISQSKSSLVSSSSTSNVNKYSRKKQIILIEDLPNILHPGTQKSFHDVLNSFVLSATSSTPLVIIISYAGSRGELRDENISHGGGWGGKDVADVRNVIPKEIFGGPYMTQISFNPIAPTLLQRALQNMLSKHFSAPKFNTSSSLKSAVQQPSKEVIDIIVQSSNGDIRNAVMALQFACVISLDQGKGGRGTKGKKKDSGNVRVVLEAMTRREQALALFHMIGKVLYNKRKNDPPGSSATAKEIQALKELDRSIKDPPPLPDWLSEHQRRASRVDVDALYADSPVDSSLFSLYIQQNYTQFCDELEECAEISDWLSWIDSSGGEQWYQANPHRFHLLTLSTLHSLPSPVTRRSQKVYKPEYFEVLRKSREAEEGVSDVKGWLEMNLMSSDDSGLNWKGIGEDGEGDGRRWSVGEIVTELGAILRVLSQKKSNMMPPHSHQLFSKLVFQSYSGTAGSEQLGDDEDGYAQDPPNDQPSFESVRTREVKDSDAGGWLEGDDIEES